MRLADRQAAGGRKHKDATATETVCVDARIGMQVERRLQVPVKGKWGCEWSKLNALCLQSYISFLFLSLPLPLSLAACVSAADADMLRLDLWRRMPHCITRTDTQTQYSLCSRKGYEVNSSTPSLSRHHSLCILIK